MSNNNISVVIPTCDRPDKLMDALKSVEQQSHKPDDIIVVDNGREPVSLSSYLRDINLVRTQPRIGASKARNIGVSHSTSAYVAFLDDDDIWDVHYLKNIYEAIVDSSILPACLIGRKDVIINNKQTVYKCVKKTEDLIPALYYINPGVGGQNTVVNREKFLKIGGFDINLKTAEDRALVLDFLKKNENVVCVPDAISIVGQHDDERLTDYENKIIGKSAFLKKYKSSMSTLEYLTAKCQIIEIQYELDKATYFNMLLFKIIRKVYLIKLKFFK